MRLGSKTDNPGMVKSVMLAYLVLLLHVLLIAGLGVLVIFFRGIIHYMIWIFLFGSAGIAVSGYLFYRRMKAEQMSLREMLQSPMFKGRNVEVSLLGGFASFRVGSGKDLPAIEHDGPDVNMQLEDPETLQQRELNALLHMLENNLISLDEYKKAKHDLLKS